MPSTADDADPAIYREKSRSAPTVANLAERFLAEHVQAKRKDRTAEGYRDILERIVLPRLGKMKVNEVTRTDVAKLHHDLRETPYQANRCLAVLSKMFNLAEAWGDRVDGSNPCRHVEKFKETKRERFLSVEEMGRLGTALRDAEATWDRTAQVRADLVRAKEAVREAKSHHDPGDEAAATKAVDVLRREIDGINDLASPEAIAAIRLLIFTGARRNEILTLEWSWVDLDRGEARLPDSKTGVKTLHFPPPALEVLRGLRRIEGNPYVIVGKKTGAHMVNIQKPWRVIREKAGLHDLRIHDLRHAFASIAASSGMGLPIIGKMLGHSQPATTARYAHLASDPVKAGAAAVANTISHAMKGDNESPSKPSDEAESVE